MEWSIDEDENITRSQELRRPGTEASPERRITGVGGLGVMSGDVGWLMDGLLWHSSSFVGRGTARALRRWRFHRYPSSFRPPPALPRPSAFLPPSVLFLSPLAGPSCAFSTRCSSALRHRSLSRPQTTMMRSPLSFFLVAFFALLAGKGPSLPQLCRSLRWGR